MDPSKLLAPAGSFTPSRELVQVLLARPGFDRLKGDEWIDALQWTETALRNAVLGLMNTIALGLFAAEQSRCIVRAGRLELDIQHALLSRMLIETERVEAFMARLAQELTVGAATGRILGPRWRLARTDSGDLELQLCAEQAEPAVEQLPPQRAKVVRFKLGRRTNP